MNAESGSDRPALLRRVVRARAAGALGSGKDVAVERSLAPTPIPSRPSAAPSATSPSAPSTSPSTTACPTASRCSAAATGYDSCLYKTKPVSLPVAPSGPSVPIACSPGATPTGCAASCSPATWATASASRRPRPARQRGYSEWGQVDPGDWQPTGRDRHSPRSSAIGSPPGLRTLGYDRADWRRHLPPPCWRSATTPAAAPTMLAAYRAASQAISYLISQRMDDPDMYVWPESGCRAPIDHNAIAPVGEAGLFAPRARARQRSRRRPHRAPSSRPSPPPATWTASPRRSRPSSPRSRGCPTWPTARTGPYDPKTSSPWRPSPATMPPSRAPPATSPSSTPRRAAHPDLARGDAAAGVDLWEGTLRRHTEDYSPRASAFWWPLLARLATGRRALRPRRIRRARKPSHDLGLFAAPASPLARQPLARAHPPRAWSGLEPEPRFTAVDANTRYTPEESLRLARAVRAARGAASIVPQGHPVGRPLPAAGDRVQPPGRGVGAPG